MSAAGRYRARVLRVVDVGEADRIATLLTAERGRLDVRVPQARRSRRRFGGFDRYVAADVVLAPGPGHPRLASAEIVGPTLPPDPLSLGFAGFVAELVLQCAPEELPSPELFRLVDAAFGALAGEPPAEAWARAFELKLLHVLGARPALRRCVVCGEPATDPARWSCALGGVAHARHASDDPSARPLPIAVAHRLDDAMRRPLAEPDPQPWPAGERLAARAALSEFVAQHIGPRRVARTFLEGLLPALLLALPACVPAPPEAVRVQGFLYADPAPLDGDRPIEGAQGWAIGAGGVVLAESTRPFAEHPGYHRLEGLPPESELHLRFEPEGGMPTLLPARTAAWDLYVDPGALHAFPAEAIDAWREDWRGLVRGLRDGDGLVRIEVADPEAAAGIALDLRGPGAPLLRCEVDGAPDPGPRIGSGLCYAFGTPTGDLALWAEVDGWRQVATLRTESGAVTSVVGLRLGSE